MTNKDQHQAQQQLNELLKNSHYLSNILDSQRMALSQTLAIFLAALARHDPSLAAPMCAALAEIEAKTWESPSVDGDRSLFARAIRSELIHRANPSNDMTVGASIKAM
ncbi:MAG: hypothetical protein WA071_13850 [Undibacterium umbellatum]|uniref:hypothetical protein n=1 Tax=Undibacterium umbellatum TaxID=2762300 RepID=UPI003BB55757